jgi:ribonuclease G
MQENKIKKAPKVTGNNGKKTHEEMEKIAPQAVISVAKTSISPSKKLKTIDSPKSTVSKTVRKKPTPSIPQKTENDNKKETENNSINAPKSRSLQQESMNVNRKKNQSIPQKTENDNQKETENNSINVPKSRSLSQESVNNNRKNHSIPQKTESENKKETENNSINVPKSRSLSQESVNNNRKNHSIPQKTESENKKETENNSINVPKSRSLSQESVNNNRKNHSIPQKTESENKKETENNIINVPKSRSLSQESVNVNRKNQSIPQKIESENKKETENNIINVPKSRSLQQESMNVNNKKNHSIPQKTENDNKKETENNIINAPKSRSLSQESVNVNKPTIESHENNIAYHKGRHQIDYELSSKPSSTPNYPRILPPSRENIVVTPKDQGTKNFSQQNYNSAYDNVDGEDQIDRENYQSRTLIIENSMAGCTRIAKTTQYNGENKLISFIEEFDNEENIQSNIYLAEVTKIDRSNNSLFLSYETGKICFLNIKELTKKNFTKEQIDNIKTGDRFIVQMVRERKNHKHPKVTTNVMMYGLYANVLVDCPFDVLYQNSSVINNSLYNSLKEHKFLQDCKIFIKQSPNITNQKLLLQDLKYIMRIWKHIKKISENKAEMGILHFEPNIQRMIRAIIDKQVESIVVSDIIMFQRIKSMPFLLNHTQLQNIKLHKENTNIFHHYNLQKEISSVEKLVTSKNGIRINFHKTDAIITVDVDYSSRGTGSKNMHLLNVNKMAADMIIREIIKKNIGGSVLIDFINMYDNFDFHNSLINHIKELLAQNELKCSLYNVKQLGFVFLCLPYNKYDIFNRIYENCSHCHFGVVQKKICSLHNNIYLIKNFINNLQPFEGDNLSSDGNKITIGGENYNLLYKYCAKLMVDLANTMVPIEVI